MGKQTLYTILTLVLFQQSVFAQDIQLLLENIKAKMNKVKDYEAAGEMKTNVVFLKLPATPVRLYFKKPNAFKLKSEKGISFVPRGSMSFNLNALFNENSFTIIDAGSEKINNVPVRVAKLLPNEDNGDLVLSTIYIDPASLLVVKSKTTTRENGTYELLMKYGKYSQYGLPDEILFSFNTRDYKLPKGITFDFDDRASGAAPVKKDKPAKGEVKITLYKYDINKNLPDAVFK